MSLFVIADLHLSLNGEKPMDVFRGWHNYVERLEDNWRRVVQEGDTVMIAGDISWAMKLEDAVQDFQFLHSLPGEKILLKGNHDYWWSTVSKMSAFFAEKGFTTFDFLHNNCHFYGEHALCGTRGWFFEEDQKPHNAKVLSREVGRLETSLKAAGGKPIWCFLHYPPLYQGYQCREILEMLEKYSVEQCCYGHLHGPVIRRRIEGERGNTAFSLISADYLGFVPKKICD